MIINLIIILFEIKYIYYKNVGIIIVTKEYEEL